MVEDKVDELEELFNEESHCEMLHKESACSEAVTHVAIDCRRQYLMCITAHNIVVQMMKQRSRCSHCSLPASSCWRVVEI